MEQMEAIYKILNDEDGDYGYSARWYQKGSWNSSIRKYEYEEDPKHNTFEIDGITFTYMKKKSKINNQEYEIIVASWSVQIREDDFKEYEEEIDAEVDAICSLMSRINRTGGRVEWDD